MRILVLILLLSGCAGTKWEDYNYGPAEYLAETFPSLTDGEGLEIKTANSYERIEQPTITVHVVDDLTEICGGHAWGCSSTDTYTCNIYIGERSSQRTIAHEYRHCYGWSHARAETTSIPGIQWYPTSEKNE